MRRGKIFIACFVAILLMYRTGRQGSQAKLTDKETPAVPSSETPRFGSGAVAHQNNSTFYVLDTAHNRLVQWAVGGPSAWKSYGTSGNGVAQFHFPKSIVTDSKGRFYIADSLNNRIVRIDDFTGAGWTVLQGGNGHGFHNPNCLALDRLYIANEETCKVVRVNNMKGDGWVEFGSYGLGEKQFGQITGLAVNSRLQILLADRGNGRIVQMNDMAGRGWQAYTGRERGDAIRPATLFVDSHDAIYFTEPAHTLDDMTHDRICKMETIGGSGFQQFGGYGTERGQFDNPTGIFVDRRGRIYVCDSHNQRVVTMEDLRGTNLMLYATNEPSFRPGVLPAAVIAVSAP